MLLLVSATGMIAQFRTRRRKELSMKHDTSFKCSKINSKTLRKKTYNNSILVYNNIHAMVRTKIFVVSHVVFRHGKWVNENTLHRC